MKIFLFVVLGVVVCPSWPWAQDAAAVPMTANTEVSANKNNALKQQIRLLQSQSAQLDRQEDALTQESWKLQDKNEGRAKQIVRLEKNVFLLDSRFEEIEAQVKLVQEALVRKQQENKKLAEQMIQMQKEQNEAQAAAAMSQAEYQKKKLQLMKMIYDSQLRQDPLQEAILENQKQSIAAGAPLASGGALGETQWDEDQLRQLEAELKVLEENYAQLQDLMGQMQQKKATSVEISSTQRDEENRLQGNIDDLKREGFKLKEDLDGLRSQMVDLDKRKSRLEMMMRKQP